MNFLLTTRYKDSWYELPREKRTEIAMALTAFAEKYLKAGKFRDSYSFADGRIMSVWNVASLDEIAPIVLYEHPYVVNNAVSYELDPFIDHQTVLKIAAERTARK